MYIEVNDDYGSKFFESSRIKGRGIELSLETYGGDSHWNVWVEKISFSMKYRNEKDARGCYEYLKAFV
jgi:hypothetical protein